MAAALPRQRTLNVQRSTFNAENRTPMTNCRQTTRNLVLCRNCNGEGLPVKMFPLLAFCAAGLAVRLTAAPRSVPERTPPPIVTDPGENVPIPQKFRVIYAPAPAYPLGDRARALEGSGLYLVYVRPNGTVSAVGILKSTGSKSLDMNAMVALVKWKFQPGFYSKVIVPIQFTLKRSVLPLLR
jgi:TonB family protein